MADLDRKNLERNLKKWEQVLKYIYRISQEIGSQSDLAEILENTAECVRQGLQQPEMTRTTVRIDQSERSSGPIVRERTPILVSMSRSKRRRGGGSVSGAPMAPSSFGKRRSLSELWPK